MEKCKRMTGRLCRIFCASALFAPLLFSCSDADLSEELGSARTTKITFYDQDPSDTPYAASISLRYEFSATININSDYPKNLKPGYVPISWVYIDMEKPDSAPPANIKYEGEDIKVNVTQKDLGFYASGWKDDPNHIHDWRRKTVISPATCTEDGEAEFLCPVCQKTKTDVLPAKGHNWIIESETRPASCTEDGEGEFLCTTCREKKTDTIPALDHAWEIKSITKEPDCTTDGEAEIVCARCHETSTEILGALGHDWDEGTITAAPTCVSEGVLTVTCRRCGEARTEPIPATGIHTWDKGAVTTPPTCVADGVKTYTCTVCQTARTEEIPATGHAWNDGAVTTPPTCATQGEKTYTCTICQATKMEEIPATGKHTWDAGVITSAPTGSAEGVRTYACTLCQTTRTEAVDKLTAADLRQYLKTATGQVSVTADAADIDELWEILTDDGLSVSGIALEISGSVSSIGSNCFAGCNKLTSVTIPPGVTRMGDFVFIGCTSLSKVRVPSGAQTTEKTFFGIPESVIERY